MTVRTARGSRRSRATSKVHWASSHQESARVAYRLWSEGEWFCRGNELFPSGVFSFPAPQETGDRSFVRCHVKCHQIRGASGLGKKLRGAEWERAIKTCRPRTGAVCRARLSCRLLSRERVSTLANHEKISVLLKRKKKANAYAEIPGDASPCVPSTILWHFRGQQDILLMNIIETPLLLIKGKGVQDRN